MDGEEEDGQAFQARLFVNREAAQEPAGAGVDGGAGTRCLREDKPGHRESGCHLAPDQDAKTAHRSLSPPTHTRPPSSKHKSLFHMTRPWATSVSQLAATARFATPSAPPPRTPHPPRNKRHLLRVERQARDDQPHRKDHQHGKCNGLR